MPRVATVKTKLMNKEKGGKAQVAFRNALGLCESEDLQFQEIKQHIRALAIKHFYIGLKPRQQEKHSKDRFFDDVYKAYPIFRRDDHANSHLLTYVDQYLHAKATPSSRFHKKVQGGDGGVAGDVCPGEGEDNKSDNGSECVLNLLGSTHHDEIPRSPVLTYRMTPQWDEKDDSEERQWISNSYAYGGDRRTVKKRTGVRAFVREGLPCPTQISAGQAAIRSMSLDPDAAMPLTEQQTTFREHSSDPGKASSTSQALVSGESPDASVKDFLGHAQLGHLLEELAKLGIKNQSRLRLVATWPEQDVDELLHNSVREGRIDRFEAKQLSVALRSLRHPPVSTDVDNTCDLH